MLKKLIVVFSLFLLITPLYPQGRSGGQISIAVSDLTAISGIKKEESQQISTILRGVLLENTSLKLIERERIDKIMEEQKLQISGSIDESQAVELGKILAVQQLVVGTIGVLFDKIVISVRLVNIESGQIELASTIITEKEKLFDEVKRLGYSLNERIMDNLRNITLDSVNEALSKRDYIRAKEYLDAYLRKNNAVTPEIQNLRNKILPPLAQEYYLQADRLRKQQNFREAKDYINKALGFKIEEKYFQLRDKINFEEELYNKKKRENERIAKMKMDEETQRKLAQLGVDPRKNRELYFTYLSSAGYHFGISSQWVLPKTLDLPDNLGYTGIEFTTYFISRKKKEWRVIDASLQGYAGLNFTYQSGDQANSLFLYGYFSPFLCGGFKIANFILVPGLDVGGVVEVNKLLTSGYRAGLTTGASVTTGFKFVRRFGIVLSAKLDYVYYPAFVEESGFHLRGSAGLAF